GGLRKFEPRDLLELEVPDVRHAPPDLLGALAEHLHALDHHLRDSRCNADVEKRLDELVLQAAEIAEAHARAPSPRPEQDVAESRRRQVPAPTLYPASIQGFGQLP